MGIFGEKVRASHVRRGGEVLSELNHAVVYCYYFIKFDLGKKLDSNKTVFVKGVLPKYFF